MKISKNNSKSMLKLNSSHMINKLHILINTLLCCFILSSCKPLSLHMIGDSELTDNNPVDSKESEIRELDEATIISILKENNVLTNPNEALFWSLENNQPEIAKWLICKQGADVNAQDKDGYTPLHEAAHRDHPGVAELLINAGAQINAKDNYDYTPLHDAAKEDHTGVAELLINAGAQINAKDNYGYTPLHCATDNGHTAVAGLLISASAEVNAKDNIGYTPLHWAAHNGHTAVAELLIRSGANFNAKIDSGYWVGYTPLHWAAHGDHPAVAELLIKAGTEINAKSNNSFTPLHSAAKYNRASFFELLTSLNINSNSRLVRLGALNGVESFRKLLGSEILDRNLLGLMLSYGDFNVNIADKEDRTPLDIAREKGHTEIVKILESIISNMKISKNNSKSMLTSNSSHIINKLPILIKTLLCWFLLSSCKPLSLHMTGDSEIRELDQDT
jgi:ankyrin repeat protein